MTKRLMEINDGKLIICLEGGYNLESISWASESVLRTLTGEKFPLEKNERKMDMEKLRDNIIPNHVGFEAVFRCLKEYKQYWNLDDQLNDYDKQIIKNC